jgi:hypothetical protein
VGAKCETCFEVALRFFEILCIAGLDTVLRVCGLMSLVVPVKGKR